MLEYIRWYSLGKALHVSLPKQRDMGDENVSVKSARLSSTPTVSECAQPSRALEQGFARGDRGHRSALYGSLQVNYCWRCD